VSSSSSSSSFHSSVLFVEVVSSKSLCLSLTIYLSCSQCNILSNIGPNSLLRATTIEDNVHVGPNCILLDGSYVETNCMLAPGTLLPSGARVPTGQVCVVHLLTDFLQSFSHSRDSRSCSFFFLFLTSCTRHRCVHHFSSPSHRHSVLLSCMHIHTDSLGIFVSFRPVSTRVVIIVVGRKSGQVRS
jgi:Bacterial transferase hexapeptide (six repeats)